MAAPPHLLNPPLRTLPLRIPAAIHLKQPNQNEGSIIVFVKGEWIDSFLPPRIPIAPLGLVAIPCLEHPLLATLRNHLGCAGVVRGSSDARGGLRQVII